MKIGGVNIPKKVIIIVVVLLIIVFACKAANKSKAEKQAQLEAQQREQELQEMANQQNQAEQDRSNFIPHHKNIFNFTGILFFFSHVFTICSFRNSIKPDIFLVLS